MFSKLITPEVALIAFAWAAYGAVHSLLAWPGIKNRIEPRMPRYRLAYNILAAALLLPLLIATELADDRWLWRWEGLAAWLAHSVSVLVLVGFIASSRAYDMREFMGLGAPDASERQNVRFGLSPLHRCVRHPWYFLGLVWLWTRDMDAARLSAALTITAYLWIGAWLEDRKLERTFGARYREYRRRVPGIVPRPWRCLDRDTYARLRDGR